MTSSQAPQSFSRLKNGTTVKRLQDLVFQEKRLPVSRQELKVGGVTLEPEEALIAHGIRPSFGDKGEVPLLVLTQLGQREGSDSDEEEEVKAGEAPAPMAGLSASLTTPTTALNGV